MSQYVVTLWYLSTLKIQPLTILKEVVGLPGDVITYRNKVLYVNGEPQKQKLLALLFQQTDLSNEICLEENLDGVNASDLQRDIDTSSSE